MERVQTAKALLFPLTLMAAFLRVRVTAMESFFCALICAPAFPWEMESEKFSSSSVQVLESAILCPLNASGACEKEWAWDVLRKLS
jgi:hypothetical protein